MALGRSEVEQYYAKAAKEKASFLYLLGRMEGFMEAQIKRLHHNVGINRVSYRSREEQLRATISKEEAIRRIVQVYHAKYDPNGGLDGCFDTWDQLLACETIAEAPPVRDSNHQNKEENHVNENSPVNGNVFDSCKRNADCLLTEDKHQLITQLEACTYKTPPIEVAALLEEFFREWPFQGWTGEQNYWLSVGQRYPPRRIYGVIHTITKQQVAGITTVQNPAMLFSFLIKKRVRRKRRW